ncbi:hypothetical protein ZYGR_0AD05360 [Zygosaccharomyces rouxii]|uniref:ZYRO0G18436p n=2 Tax=Zygosaccharomyces rouxii TaxID=4956 RepID=C5E164_ZYGRC|nr:uncharacterized protein ZYRO0G18436g [Zygosaccharomyces rouxii]KAH9202841.1 hypothetical protein LQ764DRAFT_174441 [Zygosaccharomyces rouxii]GAV51353.1 hypothetical protein ZYGR_0AD05360 [Zygosaccharomyces rouxii]CAR29848.1 ZYRO0G18436p [Zygosaccharomyces rouxii]
MTPPLKIQLDETTYYSTLGLSTNASDKEIHKSYVKLARELHPDKSKSDGAAELFKLISHAHSVLMDKEKKDAYDKILISKGLLNHSPRRNYHRFEGTTVSEVADKVKSTKPQRPYEKQPYGFNTKSTTPPKTKVPIFQSFNLKNYQTKSYQTRGGQNTTAPQKSNGVFDSRPTTPFNSGKDDKNQINDNQKHEEEEEANDRTKIHKVNPFENSQNSPFANHDHRHYARTKHEARAQERRSTSPIKTVPTSSGKSEGWDSLKHLLEKFKQQDSENEVPPRFQGSKKEEAQDEKKQSDKIRKAESQSIHLDDLSQSLPRENNFFDMRNVSNSIPAIKRTKLDIRIPDESPKQEHKKDTQNIAESLFVPVNRPLPRIYKTDHIPLDQYMINSKSLQWQLPAMPNFQCNILNQSEVEYCKELVKSFNEESNALKEQLLQTLRERLDADKILNERLVKVENTANWVSSKDFDFEVVNKLGELQSRQRIVAQSFANLLKSAYASDQRNS